MLRYRVTYTLGFRTSKQLRFPSWPVQTGSGGTTLYLAVVDVEQESDVLPVLVAEVSTRLGVYPQSPQYVRATNTYRPPNCRYPWPRWYRS